MEIIFNLGMFAFFLGLGLFVGRTTERRHLRDLDRREQELAGMQVTQLKSFPGFVPGSRPPEMFVGEVVIATDYLKSFLAKWRGLFGGEVRSYQSLLTRARREACLRLQEEARRNGYHAICNIRFEAADVGGNSTTRRVATVAIIASGTAYHTAASLK